MKKLQLLTGALLIASVSFAQTKMSRTAPTGQFLTKPVKEISTTKSQAVIWSNDFSDASDWIMTNTGAEDVDWTIETDVAAMPNAAGDLYPFASESVDNGYALINSDGAPGNQDGNGDIVAQLTTTDAIDLSGYTSALLRFSHNYRWWNDTRGVRVSNDNGATWTEFEITNLDGYPNNQNSGNPEIETIDISEAAGGSSEVKIQFYYNDNDFWAWYWAVDDVEILERPVNDIELISSWASTLGNSEYGRTPLNQLYDTLVLGGDVYNFGTATQTNVSLTTTILDADGNEVGSAYETLAELASDSIHYFNTLVGGMPFAEGAYTINGVVTADAADANENDNSYSRSFEITENLYSLDGMGVYEASSVSGLGASSTSNGNVMMVRYHIIEETTISGLQVMISTGSTEGTTLYPFLLPESALINADGSLNQAADVYSDRLAANDDGVLVTGTDVENGVVDAVLPTTTLAPGNYYACVEINLSGNEDDVFYILDDETVWQPYTASLYYYAPDAMTYTNGTALGIRMMLGNGIGIEETTNNLFNITPNPSNGVFTVSTTVDADYTIDVVNVLGEVVSSRNVEGSLNETFNLSNLNAGLYFVKVSNGTSENVQRVIIK